VQVGSAIDGRLKACLFAGWLTLCAALVASTNDGGGRLVTISAMLVAACAGLLRRDWREVLLREAEAGLDLARIEGVSTVERVRLA